MSGVSLGMLLALAIGVGIVKLLAWGRRSNRMDEAWAYVPGLGIIAAALLLVPRFVEAIPIRGYGVMVLLGSVTGLLMAVHRAKQQRLSSEVIYSLAFGMFICGIIGARLFFVIEYWETRFNTGDWRTTLLEIVKFTEGGLVVYGSLIGATAAFLWFCRRHALPPLAMSDLIAPSLLAGLAFGRIGCLMNGCCYGGPCDLPWAVTFPKESMPYVEQIASGSVYGFTLVQTLLDPHPLITRVEDDSAAAAAGLTSGIYLKSINGQQITSLEEAQGLLVDAFYLNRSLTLETAAGRIRNVAAIAHPDRSLPVHPTQIYSAVNAALLAWVLWSLYPLRRRDGEVTAVMLTVYPIARFLLEVIRIDESAVFGTGLSISQNISLVIFALALGLWAYLLRQEPHRAKLVGG